MRRDEYDEHQKKGISQNMEISSNKKNLSKIRKRQLSAPRLAKFSRLSIGKDVPTGSITIAAFGFAIRHRVNTRFLRSGSRLDGFVLLCQGLLRPACLLILLVFEETFQCSSWCDSWSGLIRQRLPNWLGSGRRINCSGSGRRGTRDR